MADRDVILKALQDWCWSDEAPLRFAMLDPRDLGRLAEVAAKAVGEETSRLERSREYFRKDRDQLRACWQEQCQTIETYQEEVRALHKENKRLRGEAPPPVGTPAEAQACAARSGVGEDGTRYVVKLTESLATWGVWDTWYQRWSGRSIYRSDRSVVEACANDLNRQQPALDQIEAE